MAEIFASITKSGSRNTMHDVRFRPKPESRNMAVSCMRNKSMPYNLYYRNSLIIVDQVVGQVSQSINHKIIRVA